MYVIAIRSRFNSVQFPSRYSNGVGLNCGCPQRWAMADGYGAYLMKKPELVKDVVTHTKQRVGFDFPVEVKIRIHKDEK